MSSVNTSNLFIESLIEQWRAVDQWDSWKKLSDEDVLKLKYIKTRDELAEIPLTADIDDRMIMNIRIFMQAIAQAAEKETGLFTSAVVDINREGFGRGLVLAQNIILVEKVYREAHRFYFPDIDKLGAAGGKLLDLGLSNYTKLKDCVER